MKIPDTVRRIAFQSAPVAQVLLPYPKGEVPDEAALNEVLERCISALIQEYDRICALLHQKESEFREKYKLDFVSFAHNDRAHFVASLNSVETVQKIELLWTAVQDITYFATRYFDSLPPDPVRINRP